MSCLNCTPPPTVFTTSVNGTTTYVVGQVPNLPDILDSSLSLPPHILITASPVSSSSQIYYIPTLFAVHLHLHRPSPSHHHAPVDCCPGLQLILLLPPCPQESILTGRSFKNINPIMLKPL